MHRASIVPVLLAAAVAGCASIASPAASVAPSAGEADAVAAAGLKGLAPTGPTQGGIVVDVTDGDTIRVVIDGAERRLRYIGIDTPESVKPESPVEPFAMAAAEANARLVEDARVVLEKDVSETDRYDRLLRYVWLPPADGADGWRLVNLELVEAGLAVAVDYPPDTKYSAVLQAAEDEARAAGVGMWADG